jgi:hypothetical protein
VRHTGHVVRSTGGPGFASRAFRFPAAPLERGELPRRPRCGRILGEGKSDGTVRNARISVAVYTCGPNTEDLASWDRGGVNAGSYQIGLDPSVTCNGSPSAHVGSSSAGGQDFGSMLINRPPGSWLGQRVRFSGWVRSAAVTGTAGLWMRIDAPGQWGLALDNMHNRPITGTTGWAWYEVVLDVDASASSVSYGIQLSGDGDIWLDGASVETVPACVAITG